MSDEIIDLPEFLERVQDDKELLLELLDIFVEDYQVKRKTLETAIDGKDYEEIKSIAHSLKGASGNISAKPMRECFMQLEEMGKNNELNSTDEILKNLDVYFEQLQTRVGSLKEEFGG